MPVKHGWPSDSMRHRKQASSRGDRRGGKERPPRGKKSQAKQGRGPNGHSKSKDQLKSSTAPYNFVPLPNEPILVDNDEKFYVDLNGERRPVWQIGDHFHADLCHGWIDVEIEAETPIYIRCAPPPDKTLPSDVLRNPELQHFYHHGDPDRPVIPGSSIRGPIRTLFEIVSFSKFMPGQQFHDKQFVFRAVADRFPLGDHYRELMTKGEVHGGFLERKGKDWYIRPAKEPHGIAIVKIPVDCVAQTMPKGEHCEVPREKLKSKGAENLRSIVRYIDLDSYLDEDKNSNEIELPASTKLFESPEEGLEEIHILQCGEAPKREFCYAIFGPEENDDRLIPIPDDLWMLYDEDAKMKRGLPTRVLREKHALLYLTRKDYRSEENPHSLVFFGPCRMFRIPYDSRVSDHVPEALKKPGGLDLTEVVFGTARRINDTDGSESSIAIRSRLVFEDAYWVEGEDGKSPFYKNNDGRRVPLVLSGPKATAFQHYLKQTPEAKDDPEEHLLDWSDDEAEIRGYKLYWHKKGVTDREIFLHDKAGRPLRRPLKKPKQHTVIRPVRRGTRFRGRIRFNNLTDIELGALLTVLDLGPTKRHKIGMVKPYGMGSVRITPTVYRIDPVECYSCLFDEAGRLARPAARLEDGEVTRLKRVFESWVTRRVKTGGHKLWEIPRLKKLSVMLEWDNAPERTCTRYLGHNPVTNRMNLRLWRDRPILPDPEEVSKCRARAPQRG